MTKFQRELEFVKKVVVEVGQKAFDSSDLSYNITDKGTQDFVTTKDYEVESYIIDKIQKEFKNDSIISEETKSEVLIGERTWVIDPIDGTWNFSKGSPIFGVQIALLEKQVPVVGAIYFPKFNDLYSAAIGNGAEKNLTKITTRKTTLLENSIVTFADITKWNGIYGKGGKIINSVLPKISSNVGKIRIMGASCYDFALVSSGQIDAHIIPGFKIWDILPGLVIVKEAGGEYAQFSGESFDISADTLVVAASNKILSELLYIINSGESEAQIV